jgi:chitinase
VPWLYDAAKQVMISYDDAESLGVRGKYIVDKGLGGMMIWELSSDDKAHTLGKAVWASLH